MERRNFAFLGPRGAAIAMDTEITGEGRSILTLALAFCCGKDQFEKRIARNILNGRLDLRLAGEEPSQTFQVLYEGTAPRRDVMYPILDVIREALPANMDRSWEMVATCRDRIERSNMLNAAVSAKPPVTLRV